MAETPTQAAALATLTSDSGDGVTQSYTAAASSARLQTVASILTQRFGSSWKLILILMLVLVSIALLIIILF
jgi:hypothetical protein